MGDQFETISAFGTQMPARDRRLRISLDTDQLAIFMKRELSAANAAIRANRTRHLRTIELWLQVARSITHRFGTSAICAGFDLLQQRPIGEESFQHGSLRIAITLVRIPQSKERLP